jgi:GrpB-like predicted nucleotidyltransferase (UPF0157 family)
MSALPRCRGLPAKPIIDIVLVVADSADEPAYLPALQAAGYRLVIRGDRDLYLRTKRELTTRDWTYIQNHADAKTDVVTDILRRAGVGAG